MEDQDPAITKLRARTAELRRELAALAGEGTKAARKREKSLHATWRRAQWKLSDLEKSREQPPATIRIGKAVVTENRSAERLQIRFDGKPAEGVRRALRASGFLWAPSQNAWQRKLTENALYAARRILTEAYPGEKAVPVVEAEPVEAAPRPVKRGPPLLPAARPVAGLLPPAPPKKRETRELIMVTKKGAVVTGVRVKGAAPRPVAGLLPPAPPKKTTPTTKATPTMGPALRTWGAAPEGTQRKIGASVQRASTNSAGRAGVALGRRRLELRVDGGVVEIFDAQGEPAVFAAKTSRARKVRMLNNETPAQAKRRYSREIDRDNKKRESSARKAAVKETREKIKDTRKERSGRKKRAAELCKTRKEKARETTPRPRRRTAVAAVAVGCAVRARRIEQVYERRLGNLEEQLDKLRSEGRGAPVVRPPAAKRVSAKELRQERDQAVRDELERRGLRSQIPIWDRIKDTAKFRGLSADRAIEQFSERIQEDGELVEQQQQRQEKSAIKLQAAAACGEAKEYAGRGDPQAQLFLTANCEPDGRPTRKFLSAAARTGSLFGDIRPPEVTAELAAKRGGRAPRRAPKAPRGQQSMSVGKMGSALVDTPGEQIPF